MSLGSTNWTQWISKKKIKEYEIGGGVRGRKSWVGVNVTKIHAMNACTKNKNTILKRPCLKKNFKVQIIFFNVLLFKKFCFLC